MQFPRLMLPVTLSTASPGDKALFRPRPRSGNGRVACFLDSWDLEMKLITTALAASSLLALAACNQQDAGNAAGDAAATGNEAAAPAGDKPADNAAAPAAAEGAAGGDKPGQ